MLFATVSKAYTRVGRLRIVTGLLIYDLYSHRLPVVERPKRRHVRLCRKAQSQVHTFLNVAEIRQTISYFSIVHGMYYLDSVTDLECSVHAY